MAKITWKLAGRQTEAMAFRAGEHEKTYARQSDDKLDRCRFGIVKDPGKGEKGRENVQMFDITCSPKPFLTRKDQALTVD